MNQATPPREIAQMGLDLDKFFYSDKKSWRGPCPGCGGTRRFVVFTDHPWPLFNGFCDECGLEIKAWKNIHTPIDPEKVLEIERRNIAAREERDNYRRAKLSDFTTKELWQELVERMTNEHIEWWEAQGVPEDIQRYLRIGFTPDKIYRDKQRELKHSPAYTIPWWGRDFEFKTMQYRLLHPENPADRYRFEDGLGGGSEHYYMTDPSEPMKDKVIICEGAKKGIVTWSQLTHTEQYTVIAAPSHNTLTPALEATKDCGLRYLILDPGSERRAFEVARKYPNTTAIYLPEKIDDLHTKYGFGYQQFQNVLKAI